MLTYQNFKKKVAKHFLEYMPQEFQSFQVLIKEVTKVNEKKDALTLFNTGDEAVAVSPIVYLDDFYNAYLACGSFEKIMNEASDLYLESWHMNFPKFDLDSLKDTIMDKVVVQVINRENNADILSKCPHKLFLDLAIIYRVVFSITDDGISSFILTHEVVESMKLRINQVHDKALINTPIVLGREIKNVDEFLDDFIDKDEMDSYDDLEYVNHENVPILLITDENRFIGSNVLLYDDFLGEIADELRSDLYILPTSIHEVVVLPTNEFHDFNHLIEMLREINKDFLNSKEKLSDNIYYFNNSNHEISVVEEIPDEGI